MTLFRWVVLGFIVLIIAYTVAITVMLVQDDRAESRCHQLGGRTYDSGEHCTVGGITRSTR